MDRVLDYTPEKFFYVVSWDYYDDFNDACDDLSDEDFKQIARDQNQVYSNAEFCKAWNTAELPEYSTSYIRYL